MAMTDTPVRMLITTPALFKAPPKKVKVVDEHVATTGRVYFMLDGQLVGVGQPETHKETTR